ncbi:aminopeptidase P family protein [Salinibacterium sp. ZJ450]|uniref:aminopeptidase P family protein n=1 Tax=Salinibacterium sp. ZJ450 TaxID=2708338 RepID=UPI00141E7ADF|nr:aminopeptidase P family protein [Salinibacterium sp. ZJ450]
MARVVDDAVGAGLDGVIVTPGPDLLWLTGYQPTAITERLTMLVLGPNVRPTLLVPVLERPDAEAAEGSPGVAIVDWVDGTDPYQAASRLLQRDGRFGLSDSAWAMHLLGLQAALPDTRYRAFSQSLPMMRAVKDANELGRLAMAGAAADATYGEIVKLRFAGRRETEVAADLARLLREFGHEQVDFTVVGSGPNGANPHHEAGDRVIEQGDAVVLDFGGLMYGYGSDTTRTVCVGEPSAQVREVHEVVRRAQQAAFEAVRPGVPCQEIDRVARAVITEAGYGEQFIHRTGHGIGVTTHEPPYMVEGEEQRLRPGMCFSIEPGIYLAGRFGVRIEDIVTVTDSGGERFNNTDHALRIVE